MEDTEVFEGGDEEWENGQGVEGIRNSKPVSEFWHIECAVMQPLCWQIFTIRIAYFFRAGEYTIIILLEMHRNLTRVGGI